MPRKIVSYEVSQNFAFKQKLIKLFHLFNFLKVNVHASKVMYNSLIFIECVGV